MLKRRGRKRIILGVMTLIAVMAGVIFGAFILKNKVPESKKQQEKNAVEELPVPEEDEEEKELSMEQEKTNPNQEEIYTDRYAIYEAKNGEKGVEIVPNKTYDELNQTFSFFSKYATEIVSSYKVEQKISCSTVTLLGWCYLETEDASRKISVFGQLDDDAGSLVTILYAPRTQEKGVMIDCMPCQYSLEEILNQAWYEEEVQ